MLEKLSAIEDRYAQLEQMLLEVGSDYQRAAELGIERSELEPVVDLARHYRLALARQEEARLLIDGEDEELQLLAEG